MGKILDNQNIEIDKRLPLVCKTCGLNVPWNALSDTELPTLVTKRLSLKNAFLNQTENANYPLYIDIKPRYFIKKCKRCFKKEYLETLRKEREEQDRIEKQNIHIDYKDCSFDNYFIYSKTQKKNLSPLAEIVKDIKTEKFPRVILFTGYYGTGKTHLGTALLNKAIEKKSLVHYDTLYSMYDRLKNGCNPKAKESKYYLMDFYKSRYMLVIDDFDSVKETEFTKKTIFEIIGKRLAQPQVTVIISNYNKEISRKLMLEQNGRLFSRIIGDRNKVPNLHISFEWEDYGFIINIKLGLTPSSLVWGRLNSVRVIYRSCRKFFSRVFLQYFCSGYYGIILIKAFVRVM